jgi:hypothetical protein
MLNLHYGKVVLYTGLIAGLIGCGKKEKEIVYRDAPDKQLQSRNTTGALFKGTVSITNKDAIKKLNADSATVEYKVDGVEANSVTLRCSWGLADSQKPEQDGVCNRRGSTRLENLKAGESYAFTVTAVDNETGAYGEDVAYIDVESKAVDMVIGNLDKLKSTFDGQVELDLSLPGRTADSWACRTDTKSLNCKDGKLLLQLGSGSGAITGSQNVTITAFHKGSEIGSQVLPVCGGAQCGVGGELPALGLSKNYEIKIPADMMLLSYSTNEGIDGSIMSMEILFDAVTGRTASNCHSPMSIRNPLNRVDTYCQRTYDYNEEYKHDTAYRRAYDHITFATPDQALTMARSYERFSFNAFDWQPEYMAQQSQFSRLCKQNFRREVVLLNAIPQAIYTQFPKLVEFHWCQTKIAVSPVVAGGQSNMREFWVGGFFHREGGPFNPNVKLPSGLEMVYMAELATFDQHNFINQAAGRIMSALRETGINNVYGGYMSIGPSPYPYR